MAEVITRASFNPYKWDTSVFRWNSDIAIDSWDEAGANAICLEAIEDPLSVATGYDSVTGKQSYETMRITDRSSREITKAFVSALTLIEVFYKKFDCGLKVEEAMLIAESLSKAVVTRKEEEIEAIEAQNHAIGKNVSDALSVAEAFDKKAQYYLYVDEVQRIVDSLSKYYGLTSDEAISVIDEYYRASGLIISDIAFYERELTLDEFVKKDTPAGYSPFKEFIAGDWLYKDAIFKTVLTSTNTSSSPAIREWKLNIDVPDVFDKGTVELTADRSQRVNFNRKFWEIPDVTIKVRGSTSSSAHIENLVTDIEGFTFDLLGGDGSPVEGTIYWKAEGY